VDDEMLALSEYRRAYLTQPNRRDGQRNGRTDGQTNRQNA